MPRALPYAAAQPSNIALEAATLGIHINLIQTAENQKYIFETLLSNSCAVQLNLDDVAKSVNSIQLDEINRQIKEQAKLLDGRSPSRILHQRHRTTLNT